MNTVKPLVAPAAEKTNGTVKKVEPVPFKSQKDELKKEEKSSGSFEDTLHRLNVLFDLQKKHNKLQETKANLDKFEIAQNKENSELEISDDEGNEFKTTNPVVIAQVVKFVKQLVNEKSAEIKAQIVL